MQRGRQGMMLGKDFNGSVWEFMAKNAVPESFPYKSEIDATSGGQQIIQMIISEQDARL